MNTLPTVSAGAVPVRPIEAVRVLHTSDWHLGVAVRNEPRDIDHENVIAEIIEVATTVEPDAVIHTGDLFNTGRPAMADFGLAIRSLRDLAETAPVLVLAGNHDSAVALETLAVAVQDPVLQLVEANAYDPLAITSARIRVMHRPATPADGGVITLPTRAGGRLRVAGLPFLHANRTLGNFDDIVTVNAGYADSIRKITDLLSKSVFSDFNAAVDVAVFASHLHVANARTSTEKEIHVSSDYSTDPAHIHAGYGYLAFGHIHIAQAVAAGRGRYAGSVIEVDFGEEGETKQVVVADMTPGRPTRIHDVALTAGRRIHRVRAPYSVLGDHAAVVGDGLVEVTVERERGPNPGTAGAGADEVDAITADSHSASLDAAPEFDAASELGASPDASSEGGGVDAATSDIGSFDSLAAAVHAALPDACVVGIVDARRSDIVVADELEPPETTETPAQMFRRWFAENGQAIADRHKAHAADPERVAALFEEIHTASVIDSEVEPAEQEMIARLINDAEGLPK